METTKVVPANMATSLRSTIPRAIAKQFGLKAGSVLEWHMTVKDNELVVYVRPESGQEGGS